MFRKIIKNNVIKKQVRMISSNRFFNEENLALKNMMTSFVSKEVEPQANINNRTETFNKELFKKTGDLGLLGLTVDENYGGSGGDAVSSCIVHHQLSKSDPGFCLAYLAHSLLFVNNLNFNGNDFQKNKYLPYFISGDRLGGMGMSEPHGGTDVLGMKSKLVDDGDNMILNGSKMWITNGNIGDAFLIYANHNNGLSMVIVDNTMEGFSVSSNITNKCGVRASGTAQLAFDNIVIPKENLVGEPGKATVCMMRNLEIERVALAAMSLGIAERCLEEMISYAKERTAFGKTLDKFGQIQQMIGLSYAEFKAGEAYVYNTALDLDLGESGNRIDSDGVKLYCASMAKNIADRAIQVLGGNGYIEDYVVERLWRDAKLIEIGGGTNESHQKNITKDLVKLLGN